MKKCHPNISDLIGNKSVPQDIKDETKKRLNNKISNWKTKHVDAISAVPVQTKSQTNSRILTVTHTPLLGARKSACAGPNKLDVPWAGIKDACQHQCTANCVHTSPDLRKVRKAHGSPNLEITLSRSPMMVNGKIEMFGELSEMVDYWEEQEEKEKEPRGQREGRRRSRNIIELCGIYEEGGMNSDQSSLPAVNGGGGGEGR